MPILIQLSTVRRFVVAVLVFVVAAGLAAEIWDNWFTDDTPTTVLFLSLSYEANLPTWFAGCLLLSCSLALVWNAMAARQETGGDRAHWWILAVVFAYMSLDEIAQLHEEMNEWFDLHGVLLFSWVIPGALIAMILGLSYLRFLTRLPSRTRNQFILAGAIYLAGAIGMELPLGYWTSTHGDQNFVYAIIDLIEESMELIGASLFLFALLERLASKAAVASIAIDRR